VNCLYCGKVNPPSRPKYCSKKCAQRQYTKEGRYYESKRSPGWGDKSKEARRLKEEGNRKHEQMLKEGWVSVVSVAKDVGITSSAMNVRAKKVLQEGVDTKILSLPDGGRARYVHPDAIEKLKNPYVIPEGYLTSEQAAEYMGYSKHTFQQYSMGRLNTRIKEPQHNLSLPPSLTAKPRGSLAYFYTTDDLDEFAKNIAKIRKEIEEAGCRERELKREKREQEKRHRQREYEKQTEGLISLKDALPYFQFKGVSSVVRLVDKGVLSAKKVRGQWWLKLEDVEAAARSYREQKKAKAEKRKKKKLWKTAGHKSANLRYEAKMQRKYRNDRSPVAEINRTYWADEKKGIVQSFDCKACGVSRPYYEFYIDSTYRKTGRRTSRCKPCSSKRNQVRPKKPISLKRKIRHLFGLAIKQHISKNRNEYTEDLSLGKIWFKLEEHCGYNEEILIKHLESQFVGEMSWDNHGQMGTTVKKGDFCWAIDHIVAKNSFHYTSLNDRDFIECWSMDNLRPLEWRLNVIKSDKRLRSRLNHSFRDGLVRNKVRGIWEVLPYTPQQARKHFEARFDKGMNWDNYGTYWHIDHIRPQASLPYVTTRCQNFKHCWSLNNLEPLTVSENLSKNSLWNGVRWVYNDIKHFPDDEKI
jgi:hypothetical protein